MIDCIFCKMIEGVIPATKLFEDKDFICIRDIRPQAKDHFLVIPKAHLANLTDAFPTYEQLMGRMLAVGVQLAQSQGLMPRGFRTVINTNADAGQTVFHIHAHILGGEPLSGGFA